MAVNYPVTAFHFQVEWGGTRIGFTEVSGLTVELQSIDYREGNEPQTVRKLPGLTKYGNLTLKWGITDSMELYKWRKQVEEGKMKEARRNIAIILMDEERNDKIRWVFTGAWPVKYKISDLNAQRSEIVFEILEIAFESFSLAS